MKARALARAARAALPYLLPAIAVDLYFVAALREAADGALCPTLDDAFIHFQYARSISEGRPFAYHPGDPATTGATSLLYPILLAPLYALGVRGMALVGGAHALGVACLATTAWQARRLGALVAGPAGGVAAALAVFALPQFLFMALGGMEIALVTATITAALAGSAAWLLAPEATHPRTFARALGLVGLGALATLTRPEALGAAGAVSLALLVGPGRSRAARLLGPLAALPAFLPGLLAWVTTGDRRTNGQIVKWLFASPYLEPDERLARVGNHLQRLFEEILAGVHPESALPSGFRFWALAAGLILLVTLIRRAGWRGLALWVGWIGTAAGVLIPATYYTFDTNQARYLWPFFPLLAMLVGVAAVRVVAPATAWLRRRSARRLATLLPLAAALGAALALVTGIDDARERQTASAREICAQHVVMTAHVRELPPGSRVAVGDAGALAYLGGHPTYDLVGLTTRGAALPFAHGHGSIFERLERLPAERRPTHLAYYPAWFPDFPFVGPTLERVRLAERHHVGADLKVLAEVRAEVFGSGERPVERQARGALVDRLDIADVESERAHAYERPGGARSDNYPALHIVAGREVADGGRRMVARRDAFTFAARPGQQATWIFRTDRADDATLELHWNGAPLAEVRVERGRGFVEHEVLIPAERVEAENHIERRRLRGGAVGLYHDWLYQ